MAEQERRKLRNKLATYRPYTKQREFHAVTSRERLFMAANQSGKTWAGGFEMAMHLTGRYPEWWAGHRFTKPIRAWAAGVTGETTRDTVQRILIGPPQIRSEWGTGSIPADAIEGDPTMGRGIPDAIDSVIVNHVSGAPSVLAFKSYEKGREKWQGETLDLVWFDEEPDADIYSEGLTRTNATKGMVYMTFTPLKGMSEVVRSFLSADTPDKAVTRMTIDDAEHYTEEERAKIIAAYPPHEREARAKGTPQLGSGRIFPVAESQIVIPAFDIPPHFAVIAGLDFGWDHPTAAVKLAWDRESDCVYVVSAYKAKEKVPALHASALKGWGKELQWAWPHDGLQHDKGSGEQLAEQYRTHGLMLLKERATWPDGSNGVEAGVSQILERMEAGNFKVFAHLAEWLEEFRLYHRKDGKIVKEFDDLMSATRYAYMCLRFAQKASHSWTRPIVYSNDGIV